MKKISLAVLLLAGGSGAAMAQSSVTLYGIVDEGLMFNNNARTGQQFALASGSESGSRWGLRGAEDLGGGLSAVFTLEGGFSSSTGALGQNGDLFGRQAYVGLAAPTWGQVLLGRQYLSGYDYVGALTAAAQWALGGAGFGAHPADLDNLDGTYRVNNAVKYKSPSFGGFSFGGTYSFGGVAGDFSRNQIYSLAAGYSMGPLTAAAQYTHASNPNYSLWGNKANDSSTGSNMSGPVISGLATAGSQDVAAVGVNYKIGDATLGAIYSHASFNNLGTLVVAGASNGLRGTAVFNIIEANAKYMLTPALQLGASYTYTAAGSLRGLSGARYQQVNLGVDYNLSKRTDLYLVGIYQQASGHDSTGANAVAQIAFATQSSTNRQVVAVAGIRHKF
ncbi:porin [Paraburkholderia sp. Ac-20342]|uniref:porin n=1 Tax=Paraburkholderia sp. Ac-20342 TaxID=2703889 RepID=UPI00197ED006|nr:porin [Paraburkholderia sp. Ac-20342]MBN3845650.1 porin [Paraburkholderia sp. Ac-20342]